MSLTSYVNYCRFAAQFTMLAIFVASMRIFSSEPILTAQTFAVPTANFELCECYLFLISDNILPGYGAVIALVVRQFYESVK